MLQRWGFKCTCDLCTAEAAEIATSDERRLKIRALKKEVVTALESKDTQAALQKTHEILDLARLEDISVLYPEQQGVLARIYLARNDRKSAERHAQMAIDNLEAVGYIEPRPGDLQTLMASFEIGE
jgi:restriction endonuclease Mrr